MPRNLFSEVSTDYPFPNAFERQVERPSEMRQGKERKRKREKQRKRNLPFAHFVPKWLQQPGTDQNEKRRQDLLQVSHEGGRAQARGPSLAAFPGT